MAQLKMLRLFVYRKNGRAAFTGKNVICDTPVLDCRDIVLSFLLKREKETFPDTSGDGFCEGVCDCVR